MNDEKSSPYCTKDEVICTVINKFINGIDGANQMYVLGYMQGVEAERARNTGGEPMKTA